MLTCLSLCRYCEGNWTLLFDDILRLQIIIQQVVPCRNAHHEILRNGGTREGIMKELGRLLSEGVQETDKNL